ncbi:hypothetical protein EYF80_029425 [Liparis tanakae]|uniref:Uncharacterized protein n=1 Tax=Liparis tanakae TaxID=230148 RepID=A0A4Z2H6C7_9TELE|nr:hypothetical protein EYF80_029425 [Liparis tanakae]
MQRVKSRGSQTQTRLVVVGGELTDCQEWTVSIALSTEDHDGGQCPRGPPQRDPRPCRETGAVRSSCNDLRGLKCVVVLSSAVLRFACEATSAPRCREGSLELREEKCTGGSY